MSVSYTILLLDDEPMILMDLQFAGEDRGCRMLTATTCAEAHAILKREPRIDVAILDVSLADDCTCAPVAMDLKGRGIPFILHSGDYVRGGERVTMLKAPIISKPVASDKVIAAAIAYFETGQSKDRPLAAE